MAKNIFLAVFAFSTLTACSLYQSSGREVIEKDSGHIVTQGLMLEIAAKYECIRGTSAPDIWNDTSTPLNEYSESNLIDAQLTQVQELPVVLVSLRSPTQADFEGCTLQILDSKLSSQRLKDVVSFGEKLLTTPASNNEK